MRVRSIRALLYTNGHTDGYTKTTVMAPKSSLLQTNKYTLSLT